MLIYPSYPLWNVDLTTKYRRNKLSPDDVILTMKTNDSGHRHILENTHSERDLGVLITSNLKFGTHAKHAAAKASSVMGQWKRKFRFWTKFTFKTIFSAFVRPHLEYAAPVWSPYSKKDIAILEKVQRSATKLVPGIRNLSYHDRLLELDLTTLEERRIRGDLIQFF